MKQIKNSFWMVCAFASALVCPTVLQAESLDVWITLYATQGAPICYTYDATSTSTAESTVTSGTPLIKGERVGLVLVRDTRSPSGRTTPPFTLDAAGNLIPAEDLTVDQLGWCTVGGSRWMTIETPGLPGTVSGNYYAVSEWLFSGELGGPSLGPIYPYVVALDTRKDGRNEAAGVDTLVARYAIRGYQEPISGIMGQPFYGYFVGNPLQEAYNIDPPGLAFDAEGAVAEGDWQSVALFNSLTVEIGGVETTLTTPAEIEAYLKPVVAAFTLNSASASATLADESAGTPSSTVIATFELTATSPDLVYYALETRSSLNADDTWQSFNDFIEEKGLDNSWQKDYTRLRIDGSALSIPVLSNETGRFYRLRMVNQ